MSWLFDNRVEGEAVAVEAKAGDDALADGGQQRLVAEGFTGIDVADVNLDHGGGDGCNGVGDGNRRVGVAAGIEDDGCSTPSRACFRAAGRSSSSTS